MECHHLWLLADRTQGRLFQEPNYSQARQVFAGLQALAAELGVKPVQLAIAWAAAQPNVLSVIVGSQKPAQIEDLRAAGDLTLSAEIRKQLQKLSDKFRCNSQAAEADADWESD